MYKIVPSFLFLLLIYYPCISQVDDAGSGRTINFDGVDDYVDAGNIYDNLTFPITISAWVYKEPSSYLISPIFVSQDNAPVYNGFWFCLSQTNLFFEYGDGRGDQSSSYRRGKSVPLNNIENRWIHVAAVVKSGNDIQLFANGQNVGGSYTGSSSLPMASNYPGDVAKIGYFFTNSVLHRFKGMIDEVRIWNRALTEQEIRESMCKRLTGTEPGLIGYWNFDETGGDIVLDESPNGFNGTLQGNPQRVFSGAPVGDESSFLYTTSWTAKELSHDNLLVSNIQGTPFGVHIYKVINTPSQTGGLDPDAIPSSYYGIFLADDSGYNTFDFSLTNADAACNFFERKDNSVPDWNPSLTFTNIQARVEIIPSYGGENFEISLGPDARLCDRSSHLLTTNAESAGKIFSWSTGDKTAEITVTTTGLYSVEVTDGCKVDRDTIEVTFLQTPPAFSLGADEELCQMTATTLSVNIDPSEYQLQWQDASSGNFFVAKDFGTYGLKVINECGSSSDSVTFSMKVEPDFTVDLGPNTTVCDATYLVLNAVDDPQSKSFRWSNGEETSSVSVKSSGMYSVEVTGECATKSDTIWVSFATTPPTVFLGENEELCAFKAKILAVDLETDEFEITWQDGSSEEYFLAETFGTYWVTIASACGTVYDTITFTEKKKAALAKQYNFISPDTDDVLNQYLTLKDVHGDAQLTVFNRWGKEVYRSAKYDNSWDGGTLPAGVYFYTLAGDCFEPYKGTLTIMR